jgi:hypothetical protein
VLSVQILDEREKPSTLELFPLRVNATAPVGSLVAGSVTAIDNDIIDRNPMQYEIVAPPFAVQSFEVNDLTGTVKVRQNLEESVKTDFKIPIHIRVTGSAGRLNNINTNIIVDAGQAETIERVNFEFSVARSSKLEYAGAIPVPRFEGIVCGIADAPGYPSNSAKLELWDRGLLYVQETESMNAMRMIRCSVDSKEIASYMVRVNVVNAAPVGNELLEQNISTSIVVAGETAANVQTIRRLNAV